MSRACGFCPGFGAQSRRTVFSMQGDRLSFITACSTNSGMTCTFSEKPSPRSSSCRAKQNFAAACSRAVLVCSKISCNACVNSLSLFSILIMSRLQASRKERFSSTSSLRVRICSIERLSLRFNCANWNRRDSISFKFISLSTSGLGIFLNLLPNSFTSS